MMARLVLPARVDRAAAAALTEELRAHAAADVAVDAGAVTQLGALGLQTLVVAARAWRDAGHDFAVHDIGPEVAGQLADLGLADLSLLEGAAP
jgi:anti-anti-sigma regulatory factor